MKLSAITGLIVSLTLVNSARCESLTNDSILALSRAGLSEGLVIDKINSEACNYDVSTEKLISLKQSGLPDGVLGAMVRRCATLGQQRGIAGDDSSDDPNVKHSPGVYSYQTWLTPNKLQLVRPSKPSGMKTSGNGSIMFPLKNKMVVPGSTSSVAVAINNPVFYFYFDVSDEKVSDFGMANSSAVQSPDEFSLVKFAAKGADRELTVGKVSFYGNALVGMKQGVDAKETIRFNKEEVAKGVFKVLTDSLAVGEYAFVLTGADGNSRIYAFSVSMGTYANK